MPTIEISAEQSAALARGEDVVLSTPPAERRYIVTTGFSVWDVTTTKVLPEGQNRVRSASLQPACGDVIKRVAKLKDKPVTGWNPASDVDGYVRKLPLILGFGSRENPTYTVVEVRP